MLKSGKVNPDHVRDILQSKTEVKDILQGDKKKTFKSCRKFNWCSFYFQELKPNSREQNGLTLKLLLSEFHMVLTSNFCNFQKDASKYSFALVLFNC